jgi:hypothetical protein
MITVVTGEPRSGTSLMMNILKTLGCDILGSQFPSIEKGAGKEQIKRSLELNPDGFWEVPGLVARGGRKATPEDLLKMLSGKTVKLISRALLQTPREVIEKIDKIIFCSRNPREVMQSQTRLVSNVMVATPNSEDWKYTPEITKINYTKYKESVGRFILAAENSNLWDKILVVDYHDMMFDTEEQIKRICDYLELPYDIETYYYKDGEIMDYQDSPFDNAKSLIKKELYRSKQVKEYDKLALDIYKSLKNKEFDKIRKSIKKFISNSNLKNTRWLDDTEFKTWVIGGWDLYKSLITNNKGVRDKLQATAKINSLPIRDCMHYDPTGEEYTIMRVKQLPDLTRTKIKCSHSFFFLKDNKERPTQVTRETCYNCWQRFLIKRSQERKK